MPGRFSYSKGSARFRASARLRTEPYATRAYSESIASRRSIARNEIAAFYPTNRGDPMNSIVYIVGLIVIVVAILSFLGLR
ncbi:MAG TPA: hypothetical protein VGQ88_04945 [Burkholderiales bacterium]|nr:hypothetical protein [Burkholderiales bacterium]